MKIKKQSLKFKIINLLIKKGKKTISEKLFLQSFKLIQKKTKKNIYNIIKILIINISFFLQVKTKKRRKKIIYEIPFLLKPSLRIFYSFKNILNNLKKKKKAFIKQFSEEIIQILNKSSDILKIQEKIHKYSVSKKIFSHFRWFY